jgi:hypothetical protein
MCRSKDRRETEVRPQSTLAGPHGTVIGLLELMPELLLNLERLIEI